MRYRHNPRLMRGHAPGLFTKVCLSLVSNFFLATIFEKGAEAVSPALSLLALVFVIQFLIGFKNLLSFIS